MGADMVDMEAMEVIVAMEVVMVDMEVTDMVVMDTAVMEDMEDMVTGVMDTEEDYMAEEWAPMEKAILWNLL